MNSSSEFMIGTLTSKIDNLTKMTETLASTVEALRANQAQERMESKLALQALGQRIGSLEKKMSEAEPQIQEFVTVRTQVQTAGKLGKAAWIVGMFIVSGLASLVTMVVGMKTQIFQWMGS